MDKHRIALVTGGLGFIGRNLLVEIENKYQKIIVVDNLSPLIHKTKADSAQEHINLVIGSIQDAATWEEVSKILPEHNYELTVFHLAADTSTGMSLSNPTAHVSTNVLGTAVMCEFLSSVTQFLTRVVLTSTRAVYGEGLWTTSTGEIVNPNSRLQKDLEFGNWNPKHLDEFCHSPVPISSVLAIPNPVNIYGSTKLSQESILKIWCNSHEKRLDIFRLQNVYGPGQSLWNSYSGVISLFVKKALCGERIEVYEGGGIVRDLVFVNDVVRIIACEKEFPKNLKVIDVGSGIPSTLLAIAEEISNFCNAEEPFISNKYRIGDVRGIYADTTNLKEYQQDFQFTSIQSGISQLIDWARVEILRGGEN